MSEKGFSWILIIIIVAVAAALGGVYYTYRGMSPATPPIGDVSQNPTSSQGVEAPPSLPATCEDATGTEPGMPVITSISPDSGGVGTNIQIKGCNFSGFESDKYAWIENAQGARGILYNDPGSTNDLIKATLKSPLCQSDNSYSGLPCGAWLTLAPGNYNIYVMPWGNKSNEVSFTVTASSSQAIKLYFYNDQIKPVTECNEVTEVSRTISKTLQVGTAALRELLAGPTAQEKSKGYYSVIPAGSELNSLSITNGVAYADFNSATESGGGSCSMRARTTQIRQTLLQFAAVKSVVLSVNGNTEAAFQP